MLIHAPKKNKIKDSDTQSEHDDYKRNPPVSDPLEEEDDAGKHDEKDEPSEHIKQEL